MQNHRLSKILKFSRLLLIAAGLASLAACVSMVASAGSGLGGTTTSTAPCASGQSRNAAGQCVAVLDNTARALPFTGSPSADMARFGAVLLAAGGLAVLAAKRLRTSTAG